ncbi:MAG: N-acetylmuramoyl-L-alanine amidase [Gammaproteobacteria bacterium]|jgi:N-acetylmuramoyl-L-alanine amidase
MRILIFIGIMGLSSWLYAAPVEIENVRIWAAPENTRIVFDLSGPAEHRLTNLTDPFRTVIDIPNTTLNIDLIQPTDADRYIRLVRSANHENTLRVVFDLKKFALSKSFDLAPNESYGHRLVIDISEEEASNLEEEKISDVIEINGTVARDIVIAVDAGHGGEDPGSIGSAGTYEKHVALSLAKKLANKINKVHGMRAVLIREGDYYVKLRDRFEKARKSSADLFISIHADAFTDPRVSGSSVYVLSQKGASSEHAKRLAEKENASDLIGGVKLDDKDDVLRSVLLDLSQTASLEASIDVADRVLGGLKTVGKLHKARVESAAFAVLKSPDIPSMLIEMAYISNPQEEKNLKNPAHQDAMAKAILSGLESYFRSSAPENTLISMSKSAEHVISRGDTLSEIATRYQVSLHSLRQANSLQTDKIKIGQKLIIPVRGS